MPIFMDRHDLEESVTAEHVANIHQEDLKIEHEYGCKGLTYWFDENRKTAFCLINAPDKKALQDMHNHAHGGIPNSIIEVDPKVVESFLGRIEDPEKAVNKDLNIIDDPAYRVLMTTEIQFAKIDQVKSLHFNAKLKEFNSVLNRYYVKFNGSNVKNNFLRNLSSFVSVSDAIKCASEIQAEFKLDFNLNGGGPHLKIGICSGLPVEKGAGLFEDTIKRSQRLSMVVKRGIAVSNEVSEIYESENAHQELLNELYICLHPNDETFLNVLMEFTEDSWDDSNLKVENFSKHLGLSKSKLYRKVKSLMGKSLNVFIKEYRLEKAMRMLQKDVSTISEIAFDSGFNSPAYFSKCFYATYGVLPSEIAKSCKYA